MILYQSSEAGGRLERDNSLSASLYSVVSLLSIGNLISEYRVQWIHQTGNSFTIDNSHNLTKNNLCYYSSLDSMIFLNSYVVGSLKSQSLEAAFTKNGYSDKINNNYRGEK